MSQVFTCNHCNLVCQSRGGLTNHQRGCPDDRLKFFAQKQIEEFAQAANSQLRQEMKQLSDQLGQQGEKIDQKIDQVQKSVDQVQDTVVQVQESVDQVHAQIEFICALIQEKAKIFDMIEFALKSGENKQLEDLTPNCAEILKLVLTGTNDFSPVFKTTEYQLLLEKPEYAQPLCQRIEGIKNLVKAKNVRLKRDT